MSGLLSDLIEAHVVGKRSTNPPVVGLMVSYVTRRQTLRDDPADHDSRASRQSIKARNASVGERRLE
jgi:hypothetical protein